MSVPSALAAQPAVEGAFVFGEYNVAATVCGGPAGSPRAGEHGVAVGRFAWMDAAGITLNVRGSAQDLRGIALPQVGPGVDWRVMFYDDVTNTFRIRQGLPLSLLSKGNVWVRFPGGAVVGSPVYANVLDGSAISGYSVAGELTPWSVITPASPGQLAIISTESRFQ